MSPRTTLWVLWISAILLVPLPIYGQQWGVLPVAYLCVIASADNLGLSLLLWLQALVWAVLLWLLALAYCRWSAAWDAKIRGSIMALAVFICLILFSSIPVYRSVATTDASSMTFQWLYE